jgi:hypothetical protein
VERNAKHVVDPVGCFLDPVAVVDIDLYHAIIPLEKPKDAKNGAGDRAETGSLALFAR